MSISDLKRNPLIRVSALAALIVVSAVLLVFPPGTPADPPDNYDTLEQLGSFAMKANAQALVDRLEADGKVAFIVEKTVGGKTFYSVVHDKKPSAIVRDAMKAKIAEEEEKALQEEVVAAQEVVVPTLSGRSGPSIALMTDTTLYASPSPVSDPIGTYSSLGGGIHIRLHKGSHSIWLPVMMRQGFARAEDAREADFAGSTEDEGPALEVVLHTQSGDAGPSIAIMTNTTLYNAPLADAAPIGTYSSLGEGRYVNMFMGFHGIEFPYMETYGYVSPDDARDVEYTPEEPGSVPDEKPDEQ